MKAFLPEICVLMARTLGGSALLATLLAAGTNAAAEKADAIPKHRSFVAVDQATSQLSEQTPRLLSPLNAQPLASQWLCEDQLEGPILRSTWESLDRKLSNRRHASHHTATGVTHDSVEEVFADVWPDVARALGESPGATGTLPISAPVADSKASSLPTSPGNVSASGDKAPATPQADARAPEEPNRALPTATNAPNAVQPLKGSAATSSPNPPNLAAAAPTVPQRSMPPSVAALREPLSQCLQLHVQNRLNTTDDGCWSVMHAFLGWGPNTEIHVGGPRGKRVNAIRWMTQNQPCAGQPLFQLVGDQIRGREGAGFQGHPGQFLAMLAQTGVDATQPMQVENRMFTVADLVRSEQVTCAQNTELTFKLLGLSYYVPTNATWKNEQGEVWDFSRIVQLEIAQPINGAACGGTHRLMGLTFSLAQRKRQQAPIDGHWARAEKYIQDYQRYTLSLQNRDGSFSSDWFKRRAEWGDLDRRVQTSGHMMEWLIYSLPDDGLYHPQVVQGVNFLVNSLIQHRYHDWSVGPKHHAIRALRLYQERVFLRDAAIARQPAKSSK